MLEIILTVIATLVAIFLIIVALQPADFEITRTVVFNAPAAALFEQINDFHKWHDWSPWAKLDPDVKRIFNGPPAGPGAAFEWDGNRQVGHGRMTITDTQPNERIAMKLEFMRPFVATHRTEFTLRAHGAQTALTWSMTGRNGFIGKGIGMLMRCDKMIGGQYEQGFANLRRIVEAPAGKAVA